MRTKQFSQILAEGSLMFLFLIICLLYTVNNLFNATNTDQVFQDVEECSSDFFPSYLIRSSSDIVSLREKLIEYVWGNEGFPHERLPDYVESDTINRKFYYLQGLEAVDTLHITDPVFGLNSTVYHFHPLNTKGDNSNELIIYHEGHTKPGINGLDSVDYLLKKGYSVMLIHMPLQGVNPQPIVNLPRFGKIRLSSHDHLKFLESDGFSPIKFFLEPVVVSLNYAEKSFDYSRINMVGFSGGGWITSLIAAIDPRISKSYSIAGSFPVYLRSYSKSDWGDYEQNLPDLYRIATYPELYVMGSSGSGRSQLQLFNMYDSCCFKGRTYLSQPYGREVNRLVSCIGMGSFDVEVVNGSMHKVSEEALQSITENLLKDT